MGKNTATVHVATESFSTEIDGEPYVVHRGDTRVRGDHPLVTNNPEYFKPAEDDLTFDLEQATTARGGRHGGPKHTSVEAPEGEQGGEGEEPALGDLKREELDARAAELGVESPEKLPNKDAVIEAIQGAQGSGE